MVCCHRGLSGGEDYHHVTKRSSISSIPDYSGINTKDTIREGCLEMRPRGRRGGLRGEGSWATGDRWCTINLRGWSHSATIRARPGGDVTRLMYQLTDYECDWACGKLWLTGVKLAVIGVLPRCVLEQWHKLMLTLGHCLMTPLSFFDFCIIQSKNK